MIAQPLRLPIAAAADTPAAEVSALLVRPERAHALYVLAHGAGADMNHAFMHDVAAVLAERGVASLRYQFPYTEHGSRRIERRPLRRGRAGAAAAGGRTVAGRARCRGAEGAGGPPRAG
ncbi:MAG: alpha/beta hydrolase, partial [Deltaproteobacteria bacterium]|nr:alpha/beta hydrolase [Nannocystaceae bacterium]